jgi:PRTRC genetic system protein E
MRSGSDRNVFETEAADGNPERRTKLLATRKSERKGGHVFIELVPMLAGRTVMITVAREDDKAIRVCIIPKKAKDDENPALTTPLSYTGTPEELDAELGKHLASYVECHTQLGSTLAQAKAEMDAAAKAAQDEARKKAADRGKRAPEKQAANTDSAPAAPAPPPAATMTLFGGSQPTITPTSAASPTATAGGGGESTCRLAL